MACWAPGTQEVWWWWWWWQIIKYQHKNNVNIFLNLHTHTHTRITMWKYYSNCSAQNIIFNSMWNSWQHIIVAYFYKKCVLYFIYTLNHSLDFAVWLCQAIYRWKRLAPTYFMHILLQLISSKAAVFFISDENSGWLPISLLLIISFSFDLHYDCSVRHAHLFISFAWWDGPFGDCTDWCTLKLASEAKLEPCERAHAATAYSLCVPQPPAPCCITPRPSLYHVYFHFM